MSAKGPTAAPSVARRVRERPPGPVLIDTAVLLWWVTDPARLSRLARAWLTSPSQELLVSAVSFWEIGSNVRRGQLNLPSPFADFVETVQQSDRISIVPVDLPIWRDVVGLDWEHRDPADRIIVATARRYRTPLVSSDHAIRAFYPDALW